MVDATSVQALLGPTNTGKTHRAIERMLDHDTGMIGLPLRLLAREVYDRVTAKVGESRVALVTGEERRVPKHPDYWVCTVEAMPVSREVDFVAVDEVQLAAHAQRGHVFTDRLLHARGRKETWFLGSDAMRDVLAAHVPVARVVSHPRLSRLSHAGASSLARVPPRSAVVAFSMAQVYEIAEKLRVLRGGCAVVLGALSPRTRNAQVAMYQAGEVDYLVATDAIGMGLNLDVRHVAFAALRKFDGRDARGVELSELAQIAGRAGRYVQDGTFGTLAPLALSDELSTSIEMHRVDPVRRVFWRRHDLDFTSVDDLRVSLLEPPTRRGLARVVDADDAKALDHLAASPKVRAAVRSRHDVALLWEVCSIPDFRKLLFEAHAELLETLFLTLSQGRGRIPEDWFAAQVAPLDDPEGDVESLVARIAAVRTWTFIANRGAWLHDAAHWQERTRAIEDRLSDALHQRLVMRFVDEVSPARPVSAPTSRRRTLASRAEVDPAHPFAGLAVLRDRLAPQAPSPRATRDAWVESLVAAETSSFTTDARGRVSYDGRVIARLLPGASIVLPDVRLIELDDVGAGARARVQRRMVAYGRDLANGVVGALEGGELATSARGVAYRLIHGLGSALREELKDLLDALDPAALEGLIARGLKIGSRAVWLPSSLRADALAARAALAGVFYESVPEIPRGRVAVPAAKADPRAYRAMGFPLFAGHAVRVDLVERVHGAAETAEGVIAGWLGLPRPAAARVIAAIRG